MFKILTVGALALAASSLNTHVEVLHEQTWGSAQNLTDTQKSWDEYYRKTLKALGDSEIK